LTCISYIILYVILVFAHSGDEQPKDSQQTVFQYTHT